MHLIEAADMQIYVITPDEASVKNATTWFGLMSKVGLPVSAAKVLLNKAPSENSKGCDAARRAFGDRMLGELPFAQDAARLAMDTGTLLGKGDKQCPLALAMRKVAGNFVEVQAKVVQADEKKGFLSRWFGL